MSKFKLKLTFESVEALENQITQYVGKVEKSGPELTRRLTEQGVSIAQLNASYMNVYDSGELVSKIDSQYEGNKGKVVSGAAHSAFCEFGTGVVGQGSSHPEPPPGWAYDVNEHGEEGWWYYDDQGNKRWTKGMPSRPYMYDTARMLRGMVEPIAKEVLK